MIRETLIATAFLSTQSPYILPPGEEIDARRAHHRFRDEDGDFISYLKLFEAYVSSPIKQKFCEKNYLDERAMAEILNVVNQLTEIISSMKIPLLTGGSNEDYLSAVARGLIQFVCVRDGRELYRSLTADRILIHPGSVMFRQNPEFIVAGEIVKTARTYAMSVSPLSYRLLAQISSDLVTGFGQGRNEKSKEITQPKLKRARDFTNHIKIGSEVFEIETVKGKKQVKLLWEKLKNVIDDVSPETTAMYKGLRGVIILNGKYSLLGGEKLKLILSLAPALGIEGAPERAFFKKTHYNSRLDLEELLELLPSVVKPALWKKGKKELGFICLFTNGDGDYWIKCSRGFHTCLHESLASVEALIDELGDDVDIEKKHIVNQCYRRLSDYIS